MDIVESINRYLAGSTTSKGQRTRLTRARDEIVRLRASAQEPVAVTYQEAFETMQALYNGNFTQQSIAVEFGKTKLYTSPPQRRWVGLTDEEIMDMYNEPRSDAEMITFGREVEAALKEKNT